MTEKNKSNTKKVVFAASLFFLDVVGTELEVKALAVTIRSYWDSSDVSSCGRSFCCPLLVWWSNSVMVYDIGPLLGASRFRSSFTFASSDSAAFEN